MMPLEATAAAVVDQLHTAAAAAAAVVGMH